MSHKSRQLPIDSFQYISDYFAVMWMSKNVRNITNTVYYSGLLHNVVIQAKHYTVIYNIIRELL